MLTSERNPTVLGERVGVGAEFLEVRSKRKLRVEFSTGDRKESGAAERHHLSEEQSQEELDGGVGGWRRRIVQLKLKINYLGKAPKSWVHGRDAVDFLPGWTLEKPG